MKLGVIADDFTGASDIALMLAEGGMQTRQFVGVPQGDAACEAGVVSLKCRTIPAAEAVEQTRAACHWLRAQGAQTIIYKVCSTFDSTADGNIGPVADALSADLGEDRVIVCPAFPENGRSVYMGHLFVGDVPLNESGMQDHPLTPMTDPDLRRVMAAQSELPVAHLSAPHVWAGAEALRADLAALPHDRCHVIVDAIRDQDLRDIARATEGRAFMVGGSGIAIGMPELFGHSAATSTWTGQDGPGAILSGSCSRATRGQVAAFGGPTMTVSAEDILSETCTPVDAATWVMAQDRPGLVTTSSDPAQVTADQDRFGRETVAAAVEGFHAATARALSERGVRRIVVAGGETSGAVVEGLGLTGFEIGPRIAAGVPALQATDRPLTLALKSGNFGGPDFFELALATLGPAQAA